MGIVRTVWVCIPENAGWKTGNLSEVIEAILLCTTLYLHRKSSHTPYVQYKRVSSMFFNVFCMLLKILFYMGKVRTVWVCIAEIRVQRRVFYPKISHRSCYVQHCTCTQKGAMHSLFNIKEFNAGFSTLYYTLRKCILHGNSAYSVRLQCALKDGCLIRRYPSDPAMYSTEPAPKK